jgi:hypothetical protein
MISAAFAADGGEGVATISAELTAPENPRKMRLRDATRPPGPVQIRAPRSAASPQTRARLRFRCGCGFYSGCICATICAVRVPQVRIPIPLATPGRARASDLVLVLDVPSSWISRGWA